MPVVVEESEGLCDTPALFVCVPLVDFVLPLYEFVAALCVVLLTAALTLADAVSEI